MTRLTDDREYTQDEGETVDLVIWEEWVNWVNWESSKNGGETYQPKEQDGSCTDSQRRLPLTDIPF